jgi:hypothetical protein
MKTLLLILFILLISFTQAQTYVVTTENDVVNAGDGVLSLREALSAANTAGGKQTITFDQTVFLPGANRIIYLKSALNLTDYDGVIINGKDGKVTLDGSKIDSNASDFKNGLVLTGGNNAISNLYLQNFLGAAIKIDSLNPGNNTIGPNNRISKNLGAGILIIDSDNNTITENAIWNCGNDTLRLGDFFFMTQDAILLVMSANTNMISGNDVWANYGSGIGAYESTGNTFTGNYAAINYYHGISVYEGSGSNLITGNDLLGNWSNAVVLFGGSNDDNQISANSIGDTTDIPVEMLTQRLPNPNDAANDYLLPSFKKVSPIKHMPINHNALYKIDSHAEADMELVHTITAIDDLVLARSSGISLQGGSKCLVEYNLFYNINSYAVYIMGYQEIDTSGPLPNTLYYFPEEITIRQNRFERINGTAVLFDQVMDILTTENYFSFVGGGIAGNGVPAMTAVQAGLDSSNWGTFTISANIFNTSTRGDLRANKLAAPIFVDGRGAISVTQAKEVRLNNNEMAQFYGGIFVYNLDWLQIDSNTLKSINGTAVYIDMVKEITVSNNILEDVGSMMMPLDKAVSVNLTSKDISSDPGYQLAADGAGGIALYNLIDGNESHALISNNTLTSVNGIGLSGQYLTSIKISDNHLSETASTALYLSYIRHLEVEENEINRTGNGGIYAVNSDTVLVKNNLIQDHTNGYNIGLNMVMFAEITNNQCSHAAVSGIYAAYVDSALYKYNVIRNSGQHGLYLNYGGYANIQHNDIYGNTTGLYSEVTSKVIARNNNFTRNTGDGIMAYYVGQATFNSNNFLENGNSGIQAYACTTAVLDSNYFSLNRNGIYTYAFDSLRVKYNSFIKNSDFGLYNGDLDTLDATLNYWGHANGPALSDTLFPGIAWGDRVSDRVEYDPFLTLPAVTGSMRPAIEAIEPSQSPREGGGAAALRGRQFLPEAQVFFATTPAEKVVLMASNLIGLEIPPGKGGHVDLIVVNPDGRADTLKNGFFYDNHAPLPFDLISPSIPDTVFSPTPDFKWTKAVDPDDDDVEYVLMYSLFDTFKDSVYFAGIEDTVYTPENDSLTENTTYYWRVLARDNLGGYAISSTRKLLTGKFPVEPNSLDNPANLLPATYALHQNYPNPFNPETTIRYDILHNTHVEISVYNTLGQKVTTLVNKQQKPGRYSISWNAGNHASGVYFYVIRSEHFTKTRKLILLK